MTTKRELESVGSILMLLAGIFLLLGPLQSLSDGIRNGNLNVNLTTLLFAILGIVSFAITWKGNSTAGGLLSLIVSLYLLFGRGASGGFEATAAAFLLAGGLIAMLAGRNPPVVYAPR